MGTCVRRRIKGELACPQAFSPKEALRAGRDELRAAAICTDVRLRSDEGEERDAIRLELEAATGDPLVVVVPYADRQLDEPFGMTGERRIFA